MESTRKDRIATLLREIEDKWEEYWWKNMQRIMNAMEIYEYHHWKLSCSPYITQKRVESQIDAIYWDFHELNRRHIIDDEFRRNHAIMVEVQPSYNNLTFENMSKVLHDFEFYHPSDVSGLMPFVEIDKHIDDYPWSWRVLKYRSDLTLEFAIKWFPLKEIAFNVASQTINVSLQDIKKHEAYWLSNINWEEYVLRNKSITTDIVHEYFYQICYRHPTTKPYNNEFIKHLTFEMYLCYIEVTNTIGTKETLNKLMLTEGIGAFKNLTSDNESFEQFQSNGNVNLSIIEKYPYIKWNHECLAKNPTNNEEHYKKYFWLVNAENIMLCAHNMTFNFLIEHRKTIIAYNHREFLLDKEYPYEKMLFVERKYREHMAAYKIQKWWWLKTRKVQSQCILS
jgi:hypothetical protein